MVKKPFFSLARPKLKYPVIDDFAVHKIVDLPLPSKVTLYLETGKSPGRLLPALGEHVKTGQKIMIHEGGGEYLISTVTGSIKEISDFTGTNGSEYKAVNIEVSGKDQFDEGLDFTGGLSEKALEFLSILPGVDPSLFIRDDIAVDTLLVFGIDRDLLVTTNQVAAGTQIELISKGIEYLKGIFPLKKTLFLVPPELADSAAETGIRIEEVKGAYPDTLPVMILKDVLGIKISNARDIRSSGIGVINAEGVVALASALDSGRIPVDKIITVIDRDNRATTVKARIGTPISHIFQALGIEVRYGDRIVMGGPMMGNAVYSEDIAIRHDTDALMVQDGGRIAWNSDSHCINCGECVRACPAKVPVNMLVRLLENGLYEEAANDYDLLSCIECGLCTYVCVAKIPIFHYIMLGKHEYARINNAEELSNA